MDVTAISSSGSLSAYSGATGGRLAGFPLWLAGGVASTSEPPIREPLSANITIDINADGHDESLVRSRSGWLYAIDVSAQDAGPALLWSMFMGSPVTFLAVADVDGDAEEEILLSTADGIARVIDTIGVAVEITEPVPDDCISGETTTVGGTSINIESVDVYVSSSLVAAAVPVDGGEAWTVDVGLSLIDGLIEITAEGKVGGLVVAVDQLLLALVWRSRRQRPG